MTISNLKGRPLYMLECIHYRLFLSMTICTSYVPLSLSSSLHNVPVAFTEGRRQYVESDQIIIVYGGAL